MILYDGEEGCVELRVDLSEYPIRHYTKGNIDSNAEWQTDLARTYIGIGSLLDALHFCTMQFTYSKKYDRFKPHLRELHRVLIKAQHTIEELSEFANLPITSPRPSHIRNALIRSGLTRREVEKMSVGQLKKIPRIATDLRFRLEKA